MGEVSDAFEAEVRNFIGEMKDYRGEMREFKSNTERRLTEGNLRMGDIEKRIIDIARQPVCVFHAEVIAEQKAQQREQTNRDTKQDTKITDLEKQDIIIKLTPRQALQLNAASIGAILLGVWEVVKYVFHITA